MTAALPEGLAELGPVTGRLVRNGYTTAAVYPVGAGTADHLGWAGAHRDRIRACLDEHGAVLLTDLPADLDLFTALVRSIGGEPLEYTERSTPRTKVGGNVYTSTEYPPDQAIPMHNESSYSDHWPELLFFLCRTPAESGGGTPIADSRAVLRLLEGRVRDGFADGVVYTRTFREGFGLSWQESFQTDSRTEVERYCRRHGQRFAWTPDGGLRTSHLRPAWRTEPGTGAEVWFNQANLFHVSALDPEVQEALLELYAAEDLPRNAYHGDGRPISREDIAAIDAAYARAALTLPWRPGDVLIVKNMLVAHGREPYTGSRSVLVALT
ncbi:TauD/TfdA family dioxygenase [Actinomadura opuntiae]|uniref:TauD/TfdA family dioxygenase n=1 Tax=Actinomadura sp. OS1-43 TaxID=604315 RepID=UPI00255A87DF|nr:TauD/TfdA family dioxygenase [Actinomadura sp. OS1-43]MDL4820044.1 TauD/TfdA family dioxygenase [Actinomadura sp. OS1-43]